MKSIILVGSICWGKKPHPTLQEVLIGQKLLSIWFTTLTYTQLTTNLRHRGRPPRPPSRLFAPMASSSPGARRIVEATSVAWTHWGRVPLVNGLQENIRTYKILFCFVLFERIVISKICLEVVSKLSFQWLKVGLSAGFGA